MKNIRIECIRDNYFVVIADTKRFGRDVMYEGNTWKQCFGYVKREKGMEPNARLALRSRFCELVTYRNGDTFPYAMEVV